MTDIEDLKRLTEELAEEVKGNIHAGPLFGLLTEYFNTINTYIIIVRNDKVILFMNNALRNILKERGIDPESFIGKSCPENNPHCKLLESCPLDESIKTKDIITRTSVGSPLDENKFSVTCMPLKYNGVSAVIEMWSKS